MASSSDPPQPATKCPVCGGLLPSADGDCPSCAAAGNLASAELTRLASASVAPVEETQATRIDGPAPGSPAAVDSHTGPRQIASYRILRELGAGGMGTVFLAHDDRMNRDVALKVMSRHQAPSEKAGRRFEQEAWIAGRLDHPNLVKVYECGTWEELRYYSMELVDGGSLADVIQQMRTRGRDENRELEFGSSRYAHWSIRKVIEAARGLDFAHRQGVVHRDVKPMNLLLSRELGSVKIADFGLAIDAGVTRMTTAGKVLGTISFMAPEQILGKRDQIDARTDVYALGVTLFELLTLELPYSGKTQQLYMSQVLTTEARRASKLNAQVSRDLETVLRKAMEKEQEDRYPTAAAFADDLDNVLHLRPIQAKPSNWIKRTAKWVQRKPVHAALVATLLVSVPTIGIVGARTIRSRIAVRQARIEELLGDARWLEERQRCRDVLDRVASVLALDSGNTMALRHRAMARFMRSRQSTTEPEEAAALERGALDDISRVIDRRPDVSWPHAMRAFMLHVLGREDEAEAEQALAAQYRADPPSDEDLAEDARLAHSREDYAEAVRLFSELLRRHPDRVRAYSSRALAQEEMGDADSAYIDYKVAVGLDAEYDLALVDLARMSTDRGLLEDAERFLDRALETGRESAFVHEIRGQLLLAQGMQAALRRETAEARRLFEEAENASKRGLELGRELKWADANLATSLIERNRLLDEPDPALMARAIEHYRRVLDRWTSPPEGGQERDVYIAALVNNCDAEIQLNRLEEALSTCSRVTVAFPDNPVGFYNLAGVHALLGRHEESLAALQRDLELGDTDWRYLAADKWFEGLRDDPRFDSILGEMKRRAQAG